MAKRVTTKKLLQKLNIEEELFCSFKSGIGIDPKYEKRSKKNSSTRYSYVVDRGNGWYSAEECWALSNAQIARHIGFYELNSFLDRVPEFYGIRAPKRLPLTWVDFDIDNANHNFEDERLFKILGTFGDEPCLVQYREGSGNFSVIMRCIPLYPEKHKAVFTEILESVGLEVKDGVVEIYPDVNRARRLPFGDQIVFLGGGYRRRPTDSEVPWAYQKLEVFDELREHYIVNPFQVLRGLTGNRTYSKNVYTPGRQSSNNHRRTDDRLGLNVDDRGKGDKSTSELSSYSQEIERILTAGLREESTRYETEKRLIRWYYATGKSEEGAYELIEDWYNSGKTTGFSKDWIRSAGKVLSALKRHVISFYRWLRKHWTGSKVMEAEPLTTKDVRRIIEACDWNIDCAEWLYDCLMWTKARKRYQKHLYLSAKIMRKFKRGRDANKKWVPFLVEKGILRCVDGDFSVGNCCRIWQVNWEFSLIGKIVPDSLSFKEALALVTTVDEIKQHYSKVTGWRLNSLRKKVAGLVLEEVKGNESSGAGGEVALEMRIESSPQRKVDNLDGVQLVFEWYPRRE